MFSIVNFCNEPIKAVARIPYRGYEISMTTLTYNNEVAIFDENSKMVQEFESWREVWEAFEWINAHTTKGE